MATTTNSPIDLRPHDDRTIGQLVADVNTELSGLIRAEVSLAKAELKQSATKGGIGAGLFVGAAVFAFVGFIIACMTVAFILVAVGLATWLAFVIVTVALFVFAGIMALVGKSMIGKVKPPQQTIDTTKETFEQVKAAALHEG